MWESLRAGVRNSTEELPYTCSEGVAFGTTHAIPATLGVDMITEPSWIAQWTLKPSAQFLKWPVSTWRRTAPRHSTRGSTAQVQRAHCSSVLDVATGVPPTFVTSVSQPDDQTVEVSHTLVVEVRVELRTTSEIGRNAYTARTLWNVMTTVEAFKWNCIHKSKISLNKRVNTGVCETETDGTTTTDWDAEKKN